MDAQDRVTAAFLTEGLIFPEGEGVFFRLWEVLCAGEPIRLAPFS